MSRVLEDSSFRRKYRVGGVPETILINRDATVEEVWIGELSDEQTEEIEKLIQTWQHFQHPQPSQEEVRSELARPSIVVCALPRSLN